jgi:flagellar biosynthetic protein FliR
VTLQLAAGSFFVFMFAMVRASAWLAFCPPFSSGAVPLLVRTGLAAALSLAVTSQVTSAHPGQQGSFATTVSSLSTAAFITGLVVQAAIGTLMGFMAYLLFGVLSAAGSLTDMTSGLSAAEVFDPISGTPNPVTANVYNLVLTTLLFATGGDLVVVKGFLTSFQAVGLSAHSVDLVPAALVSEVGYFFAASLEIAAPVLGCMFLAYVALGLLTRSAPQLNAMSLGFGVNIALALTVVAIGLPLLPGAVNTLVDRAVTDSLGILGVHP